MRVASLLRKVLLLLLALCGPAYSVELEQQHQEVEFADIALALEIGILGSKSTPLSSMLAGARQTAISELAGNALALELANEKSSSSSAMLAGAQDVAATEFVLCAAGSQHGGDQYAPAVKSWDQTCNTSEPCKYERDGCESTHPNVSERGAHALLDHTPPFPIINVLSMQDRRAGYAGQLQHRLRRDFPLNRLRPSWFVEASALSLKAKERLVAEMSRCVGWFSKNLLPQGSCVSGCGGQQSQSQHVLEIGQTAFAAASVQNQNTGEMQCEVSLSVTLVRPAQDQALNFKNTAVYAYVFPKGIHKTTIDDGFLVGDFEEPHTKPFVVSSRAGQNYAQDPYFSLDSFGECHNPHPSVLRPTTTDADSPVQGAIPGVFTRMVGSASAEDEFTLTLRVSAQEIATHNRDSANNPEGTYANVLTKFGVGFSVESRSSEGSVRFNWQQDGGAQDIKPVFEFPAFGCGMERHLELRPAAVEFADNALALEIPGNESTPLSTMLAGARQTGTVELARNAVALEVSGEKSSMLPVMLVGAEDVAALESAVNTAKSVGRAWMPGENRSSLPTMLAGAHDVAALESAVDTADEAGRAWVPVQKRSSLSPMLAGARQTAIVEVAQNATAELEVSGEKSSSSSAMLAGAQDVAATEFVLCAAGSQHGGDQYAPAVSSWDQTCNTAEPCKYERDGCESTHANVSERGAHALLDHTPPFPIINVLSMQDRRAGYAGRLQHRLRRDFPLNRLRPSWFVEASALSLKAKERLVAEMSRCVGWFSKNLLPQGSCVSGCGGQQSQSQHVLEIGQTAFAAASVQNQNTGEMQCEVSLSVTLVRPAQDQALNFKNTAVYAYVFPKGIHKTTIDDGFLVGDFEEPHTKPFVVSSRAGQNYAQDPYFSLDSFGECHNPHPSVLRPTTTDADSPVQGAIPGVFTRMVGSASAEDEFTLTLRVSAQEIATHNRDSANNPEGTYANVLTKFGVGFSVESRSSEGSVRFNWQQDGGAQDIKPVFEFPAFGCGMERHLELRPAAVEFADNALALEIPGNESTPLSTMLAGARQTGTVELARNAVALEVSGEKSSMLPVMLVGAEDVAALESAVNTAKSVGRAWMPGENRSSLPTMLAGAHDVAALESAVEEEEGNQFFTKPVYGFDSRSFLGIPKFNLLLFGLGPALR